MENRKLALEAKTEKMLDGINAAISATEDLDKTVKKSSDSLENVANNINGEGKTDL